MLVILAVLAWPCCHPSPGEGSCPRVSEQACKIPRFSRDDSTRSWSRLAMDIHTETNLVRRDPAPYARHLEALLPRFEGRMLERPGRPVLRTAIHGVWLRSPAWKTPRSVSGAPPPPLSAPVSRYT